MIKKISDTFLVVHLHIHKISQCHFWGFKTPVSHLHYIFKDIFTGID